MIVEDSMFYSLDCLKVDVAKKDIDNFSEAINDKHLPDIIMLKVDEAKIKINRATKEFRIIKRHITKNQFQSDLLLVAMIKVASQSGFKVFLEPKYSN